VTRGIAAILASAGLFTWVMGGIITAANSTASKPLPPEALPFFLAAMGALGSMFMVLAVLFGVVRTVVTERDVRVKYGLWGPTIPLEHVRSSKVIAYDWTEFGGWGIRLGKDGTWAYVPAGGEVLELRYVVGSKEKRVLVGVADPHETARQIEKARAGATAGDLAAAEQPSQPRVRVAGEDGDDEDGDDEEGAEEVDAGERGARTARSKKAR
jgi:hypothetical protein